MDNGASSYLRFLNGENDAFAELIRQYKDGKMARKLNGKQIYQLLLSALIILLAVLICSSAVGIYQEGSRRKAEDPLESVYTHLTNGGGNYSDAMFALRLILK